MKRRIKLAAAPHDPNAANVWAEVAPVTGAPGEIHIGLYHEYPDLHPLPGWWVECDGQEYTVAVLTQGAPCQLVSRLVAEPKGGA